MTQSLEKALAFHCAPALCGLKPANLICCPHGQYRDLERQIEALDEQLNPERIHLRLLCRCEKRTLLLVYRQDLLERHLAQEKVSEFLRRHGYPGGGLEDVLHCFEHRLAQDGDFPHEAGVLLGYPLADVEGFLKNKGKNCKLCGYWKVYSDEEQARKLFSSFTRCRHALCAQIAQGKTLRQVLIAA